MKKRERLIVAIPPSLEELQIELMRFPQKDRAGRLRELAWLGLTMMKGGGQAVQVQAAQLVPAPPMASEVDEEWARGKARVDKVKAKMGFG